MGDISPSCNSLATTSSTVDELCISCAPSRICESGTWVWIIRLKFESRWSLYVFKALSSGQRRNVGTGIATWKLVTAEHKQLLPILEGYWASRARARQSTPAVLGPGPQHILCSSSAPPHPSRPSSSPTTTSRPVSHFLPRSVLIAHSDQPTLHPTYIHFPA